MRSLIDDCMGLFFFMGLWKAAGNSRGKTIGVALVLVFPPASPFQGTLENRVLTSYQCVEMIWCFVIHIEDLNCWISI